MNGRFTVMDKVKWEGKNDDTCSFIDNETNKLYFAENNEEAERICSLLNSLTGDEPTGTFNSPPLSNKDIVKRLKYSISYRSKHKSFMESFSHAIIRYFHEKHNAHVRVHFFGDTFGVERNPLNEPLFVKKNFEFTAKVLYDFCEDFECEFLHTVNGAFGRCIFTFKDVDMDYAFTYL